MRRLVLNAGSSSLKFDPVDTHEIFCRRTRHYLGAYMGELAAAALERAA
jgi:hypothetical protein